MEGRVAVKDAIELIKALTPLVWPLILAIVLWRLFPVITAIVKSRAFSLKIAGMEVSVQDAAEQVRAQIEDLQHQVIALRGGAGSAAAQKTATAARSLAKPLAPPGARSPKVLWVDDNMSNNAFQIAQLHDLGVTVVQSSSTEDAMSILNGNPAFDAVISDMGRREGGAYRAEAGLILLGAMRKAGLQVPFMIYSTQRYADRARRDAAAAGGDGATSSPVELLEWVRQKLRIAQPALAAE
jgi:CheY-like chemotaxis protein